MEIVKNFDKGFWHNKRVFITGHTGFKGSWLSLWLQLLGAEIKGFSLPPPYEPNLYYEAQIGKGMTSEIGDIRHYKEIYRSIQQFKPEIVFHMAAQSLVRKSYQKPVETYATNVMGTVHLFDAIRNIGGVKATINITSDKCYKNCDINSPHKENDAMGGHDPYSSSKGCAELITSAYRQSFFNRDKYSEHGCALASVRAGNVIGGGDWAIDRLVPDTLSALQRGLDVKIRNPVAVRPWQYVLDPLLGYLLLAKKLYKFGPEYAEGWNFGPLSEDSQPVSSIVEHIIAYWGSENRWQLDGEVHPFEANYLTLDSTKAFVDLDWRPTMKLTESIEKIVRWHKSWLKGENMRSVCTAEILDYLKKAAVTL